MKAERRLITLVVAVMIMAVCARADDLPKGIKPGIYQNGKYIGDVVFNKPTATNDIVLASSEDKSTSYVTSNGSLKPKNADEMTKHVKSLGESGDICKVYGHWWQDVVSGQALLTYPVRYIGDKTVCRICEAERVTTTKTTVEIIPKEQK